MLAEFMSGLWEPGETILDDEWYSVWSSSSGCLFIHSLLITLVKHNKFNPLRS